MPIASANSSGRVQHNFMIQQSTNWTMTNNKRCRGGLRWQQQQKRGTEKKDNNLIFGDSSLCFIRNTIFTQNRESWLQGMFMPRQRLVGKFVSEFRGIPWLFQFRTFWTPEFSSKIYFSDPKMFSRQFVTHSCRFGMLSRDRFFQFHESENIPAFFFLPAIITSTCF